MATVISNTIITGSLRRPADDPVAAISRNDLDWCNFNEKDFTWPP
jgi:hypothetical protein